ncbi:oxygen-independent coproporphyrinogen III oxidase [Pedobacter sp. UYEF25]
MDIHSLIEKYSGPVPRYTSYPTVPYWDDKNFSKERWIESVKTSFLQSNQKTGISLYIHLPFCDQLCTYCGCNTRITVNHKVEKPYINAVAKEWSLYKSFLPEAPIIKEIHLGGGTPTFFSPQHLEDLIVGILDGCKTDKDAAFSFEAHPANTTKEHLVTLFKLGFKRLSLGIQDFDPEVQRVINRWQTVEQVKEVTKDARSVGYHSINYDLIYGLPRQTKDGLINTIQEVIKLRPDRIAYYGYAHVPWVKPGQRMFTEADLPNIGARQLLYDTGRQMLTEGGYVEIGMDHFALKTDSLYIASQNGKLHRNFMGYTDHFTQLTIGLGVSSISDTWYAFGQNVKKVEEYQQLIDAGEIPVFKGHFLTEEDLVLKNHILALMCSGKTTFDEFDLCFEAFKDALERLKDLEADELVIRKDLEIIVTNKGKRFLRNICLAFDARYWCKQMVQKTFSTGD